jgi:hypothetical protein
MILVDDAPLAEALIFDALAGDYEEMFAFDWDAEFEAASEPIEPWQWEWRSPLRALQQQLIGSSDVTGWTAEAGRQLAAVLREPTEAGQQLAAVLREPMTMHPSLLELRAAETGLLPTVTLSDPDAGPVSAAGDE